MLTAALFTITKTWKHAKCLLTEEWRTEMRRIYTADCYSTTRKSELMPSATTWMDLKGFMLYVESKVWHR